MEKITMTKKEDIYIFERHTDITTDDLFTVMKSIFVPLNSPYPYLDTFIQIFASNDGDFYKMIGRDEQNFTQGNTEKLTLIPFDPTPAEKLYIEAGLDEMIKDILKNIAKKVSTD